MSDQILALLIAERDRLNRALEALGNPTAKRRGRPRLHPSPDGMPRWVSSTSIPTGPEPVKAKRTVSAAARKRMAAAQRNRWAAIRAKK